MRILIAEDEKDLNRILTSRLTAEHYSVDSCFDGQEALEYLESAEYDAAILDIMMPEMDGLTVLKKIRRKNINTPVLLLTARDSIDDRVSGLDAGANDYLVKPFAFEELLARIRVLLRKPAETPKTCYRWGTWRSIWIPIRSCGEERRSNCPGRSLHFSGTWYRTRVRFFPGTGWRSICGIMIIWAAPM